MAATREEINSWYELFEKNAKYQLGINIKNKKDVEKCQMEVLRYQ